MSVTKQNYISWQVYDGANLILYLNFSTLIDSLSRNFWFLLSFLGRKVDNIRWHSWVMHETKEWKGKILDISQKPQLQCLPHEYQILHWVAYSSTVILHWFITVSVVHYNWPDKLILIWHELSNHNYACTTQI